MRKNKMLRRNTKLLKSTFSIILSIALAVSGIKLDNVQYEVSANQEVTEITKNESEITAKQKEEAQIEDAKVNKMLKETQESKERNKKRNVVRELKEYRTPDSATYLLSDGSKKLEIHGKNIHYIENGEYLAYDASLREMSDREQKLVSKSEILKDENVAEEYAYVNSAGDAKHYFPKRLEEDSAVILTKDNYAVSFAPKNSAKEDTAYSLCIEEQSVEKDNLTYGSDGEKVSYKYTSLTNGVKEEIVLKESRRVTCLSLY